MTFHHTRLTVLLCTMVILTWLVSAAGTGQDSMQDDEPVGAEVDRSVLARRPSVVDPRMPGADDYMTAWEYYEQDALARIDAAPAWPTDKRLTEREWQMAIRVALMLQDSDPCAVQAALVAYMLTMGHYEPRSDYAKHWRRNRPAADGKGMGAAREWRDWETRPMVLLRIMFDIPPEARPVMDAGDPQYDPLQPGGCGGFPSHPIEGDDREYRYLISAPIRWTEDGPELIALYGFGAAGGGGTRKSYQPHIEYRWFLHHYPFREGLEKYLDDPESRLMPLR
jgi:hypothetical protein